MNFILLALCILIFAEEDSWLKLVQGSNLIITSLYDLSRWMHPSTGPSCSFCTWRKENPIMEILRQNKTSVRGSNTDLCCSSFTVTCSTAKSCIRHHQSPLALQSSVSRPAVQSARAANIPMKMKEQTEWEVRVWKDWNISRNKASLWRAVFQYRILQVDRVRNRFLVV